MTNTNELNLKDRRVLVTGGTGFIGRALVKGLLDKGALVTAFDNGARGPLDSLETHENLSVVEGDIRDARAVNRACENQFMVCHLAYVNGTEHFYNQPDLVLDVGVKGMVNILDACIANRVKQFVLASSSEVYQTPPVVPTPENVPLVVPDVHNPRYSYGGGKIICELMALNYGRKHFDRTLIFRPHNVFGPRMGFEHVIPQFALRLKSVRQKGRRVPFKIQGSGEEKRAFIFIDEFTRGLIRVLEAGQDQNIYHIGTNDVLSVRDLAQRVAGFFNQDIEIEPGQLQKGGTPMRCPDIGKLKSLGFEPSMSFDEGLKQTLAWYDEHSNDKGEPQ